MSLTAIEGIAKGVDRVAMGEYGYDLCLGWLRDIFQVVTSRKASVTMPADGKTAEDKDPLCLPRTVERQMVRVVGVRSSVVDGRMPKPLMA